MGGAETWLMELLTLPEGAVVLDGFDDAICGVAESSHIDGAVVAYSVEKILLTLQAEMSAEDAMEHFEYNIAGLGVENGPVFVYALRDVSTKTTPRDL